MYTYIYEYINIKHIQYTYSNERTARTGQQNRTGRKGQTEENRPNWTFRDRAARTVMTRRDC